MNGLKTNTTRLLRGIFVLALAQLAGCNLTPARQSTAPAAPPATASTATSAPAIQFRMYGGTNLNADTEGNGLALVVNIFSLRRADNFQRMPFETYLDSSKLRAALGSDLIDVREVLLVPGQELESQDPVANDERFIGVVALFRSPASGRWRYVFDAKKAQKNGITIGLHACAMTTSADSLLVSPSLAADTFTQLSNVVCAP